MRKYLFITLIVALMQTLSCHQNNSKKSSSSNSSVGQIESKKATSNEETVATEFSNDDIAKFISGLPCSSPYLKKLQNTCVWNTYKNFADSSWTDLETIRLEPMKKWADAELVEANKTRLLFYPFGGPDFITALKLFPNAENYILIGLERVGNLPGVEKWESKHSESYLEDINPNNS